MANEKLDKFAKCRDCKYYDASPFPEYEGKLAICTNPQKEFIGAGKIGFYTLASSACYERADKDG